MKKFSLWMVVLVMVATLLAACQPAPDGNTPPKPCTKVISIEALKEYAGQKVTFVNAYRGVTELQIGDQMVCVSQNGLDTGWDGNEEEKIILEAKTDDPSGATTIFGSTEECSYKHCGSTDQTDVLFFSGMSGTLSFYNDWEPRIILDEIVPAVPHKDCTKLRYGDEIATLEGKKVKIVGYSENNNLVLESWGKNYCFVGPIDVYKTIDIGGQSYHVKANLYHYATMSLVSGSIGVLSFDTTYNEEYPVVRIDIGEGEDVKYGVDHMIEEISAHDAQYFYNPVASFNYGQSANSYLRNYYDNELFVLAVYYYEEPTLQSGYLVSPKAYVNGGTLSIGQGIGLLESDIFDSDVELESVTDCNYGETYYPEFARYNFSVPDAMNTEISLDLPSHAYVAMFSGNGADQTITYYEIDNELVCPAYK
jgi:hypothetical protein